MGKFYPVELVHRRVLNRSGRVLLMALKGRIMGVSGIIAGLFASNPLMNARGGSPFSLAQFWGPFAFRQ